MKTRYSLAKGEGGPPIHSDLPNGRDLSEEELYTLRFLRAKAFAGGSPMLCYCNTTQPIVYNTPEEGKMVEHEIPVGALLRITFLSKFGDIGLSPAGYTGGYLFRLPPNDPRLANIRLEKNP